MAWYYDTVRIFVPEYTDDSAQEIAALVPLRAGTVHQPFGWNDITTKVSVYVVGFTDKNSLEALRKTGLTYVFSGPWGSLGSFFLKGVSLKPINTICQTLRPDLPIDTPVFTGTLELWKDE